MTRGAANAAERRQAYREFLNSDTWADRRERWWRAHPNAVCFVCEGEKPTDLHHLRYRAPLGSEPDRDLRPLHRACHEAVHEHQRRVGCSIVDATLAVRGQALGEAPPTAAPKKKKARHANPKRTHRGKATHSRKKRRRRARAVQQMSPEREQQWREDHPNVLTKEEARALGLGGVCS